MATITVVIPNYKGIKFIENCLSSLYAQEDGTPSFEVLVVDNASKDGSVELIREKFPQTRLICLAKNTGFCHAVNVGIENSESPYVLLLNNDTKVFPDFVKNLYLAMEQEGRRKKEGNRAESRTQEAGKQESNRAESRTQEAGKQEGGQQEGRRRARKEKIFSVSAAMLMWDKPELMDDAGDLYSVLGWAFARGKGKPYERYQKRAKIFSACGGAALYRREVLDKIGLFDENHFAYLEDLDLGYRARIKGYVSIYEPKARVIHYGSASTGSRYNAWKTRRAAANSVYVIMKNMPSRQVLVNFPFLLIGFFIKFLFFTAKGMGKLYLKGLLDGLKLSFSGEGKRHKVRYDKKNLKNYLRIEGELFCNIFRRIM